MEMVIVVLIYCHSISIDEYNRICLHCHQLLHALVTVKLYFVP